MDSKWADNFPFVLLSFETRGSESLGEAFVLLYQSWDGLLVSFERVRFQCHTIAHAEWWGCVVDMEPSQKPLPMHHPLTHRHLPLAWEGVAFCHACQEALGLCLLPGLLAGTWCPGFFLCEHLEVFVPHLQISTWLCLLPMDSFYRNRLPPTGMGGSCFCVICLHLLFPQHHLLRIWEKKKKKQTNKNWS